MLSQIQVNSRLKIISGSRTIGYRKHDRCIVQNITELGPYYENHVRLHLCFTATKSPTRFATMFVSHPKRLLEESFLLHVAFPSKEAETIEVAREGPGPAKKLYGILANVKLELAIIAESPYMAKSYAISKFRREAQYLPLNRQDLQVRTLIEASSLGETKCQKE